MSHVYVVERGEYEQRYVQGVYSTREAALAKGGDVTVYGLDGGEITAPRWWWVTCNLHTNAWEAQDSTDAGERMQGPRILIWPNEMRHSDEFPDGRLDVDAFSASRDDAIARAKIEAQGKSIPVLSYGAGDRMSPWAKVAERALTAL